MIASSVRPHKPAGIRPGVCVKICFRPMTFIKPWVVFERLSLFIKDERLLIDIQRQRLERYGKILSVHAHKSSECDDHVVDVTLVHVEHYVQYRAHVITGLVIHFVTNDGARSENSYRTIGMTTRMIFTC